MKPILELSPPGYCSNGAWLWYISVRFKESSKTKVIYVFPDKYGTEIKAFANAYESSVLITDYLGLPVEYVEWSTEVIKEHTQIIT